MCAREKLDHSQNTSRIGEARHNVSDSLPASDAWGLLMVAAAVFEFYFIVELLPK